MQRVITRSVSCITCRVSVCARMLFQKNMSVNATMCDGIVQQNRHNLPNCKHAKNNDKSCANCEQVKPLIGDHCGVLCVCGERGREGRKWGRERERGGGGKASQSRICALSHGALQKQRALSSGNHKMSRCVFVRVRDVRWREESVCVRRCSVQCASWLSVRVGRVWGLGVGGVHVEGTAEEETKREIENEDEKEQNKQGRKKWKMRRVCFKSRERGLGFSVIHVLFFFSILLLLGN